MTERSVVGRNYVDVMQNIIEGSARELPLLDNSVDLIVTSPPYFGLRDYGMRGEIGGEATPSEYVAAMTSALDEMRRVLKPHGSVFLVIGDKTARTGGVDKKPRGNGEDPGGRCHARKPQRGVPGVANGSLVGLPYRVALAAVDAGWVWRQNIVWHKPNPLPESVRTRSTRAHETVLHLSVSTKYRVNESERGGGLGQDVWSVAVAGYRDPLGRRHPAVYPPALVERIITTYSRLGDTVLDPFVGSGTTAVVAHRLGRKCLGVDLNPEYVAIARDRLLTEMQSSKKGDNE